MAFWVYILRCADGSYYAGHTDNLDLRFEKHVSGEYGGYTAIRRPVELVYSQPFADRLQALMAERQIKGWSRAKKEAMMRSDWNEVSRLSNAKPAKGIETFDSPLRPSRWANVK